MKKKRGRFAADVKRRAVERVARGEDVSAVASAVGVDRRRVYEWQEQVRQGGLEALRGPGRPRKGSLDGPPLKSALLNEGAAARRRMRSWTFWTRKSGSWKRRTILTARRSCDFSGVGEEPRTRAPIHHARLVFSSTLSKILYGSSSSRF